MKKLTLADRQKDDVRVLIEEAKIRNGLDEKRLSMALGIAPTTLAERKRDHGGITFEKPLILMDIAVREAQFVKTAEEGRRNKGD